MILIFLHKQYKILIYLTPQISDVLFGSEWLICENIIQMKCELSEHRNVQTVIYMHFFTDPKHIKCASTCIHLTVILLTLFGADVEGK